MIPKLPVSSVGIVELLGRIASSARRSRERGEAFRSGPHENVIAAERHDAACYAFIDAYALVLEQCGIGPGQARETARTRVLGGHSDG